MSTGVSNLPLLINQLPTSYKLPSELIHLREHLILHLNRISNAVNRKEGSYFDLIEQGNFQQFFTPGVPFQYRSVYRYVFDLVAINMGNIAGGSSVTYAHGITGLTNGTHIYASCTDTTGLTFTVVYPNATMDQTNIYFTNPEPSTDLTAAYFIAEYLKQ